MTLYFFSRDRLFWLYHIGVLSFVIFLQGTITYFWYTEKMFNLVAGLAWVPLFTLSVLFFRFLYKKKHWHKVAISKTIFGIFFYGLVMSALVTAMMLAITVPFFWNNIINSPEITNHGISAAHLLFKIFVGNVLQTHLLISAWIFIYISIANNHRVRESELSNLRLQNSLKEAQLANLSNQLNPHFLFNAINNIRFTIYENATKADTMLTGLSEMLRYSLEQSKQEKVRLSEELEIISLYIDLIKVQMEERLTFSVDISQNLNNYLIPPMTLQLLVENAVKHGIDKLRHGGVIQLQAESTEQQLIFTVINNCGEYKPRPNNEVISTNIGIGLVNIEERLRLLYGDNASVKIERESDNFEVTLILPRESGI